MPTKHPRIQVTADPQLAAALRRARQRHPGVSTSRLLRDLALLGEEAEQTSATGGEDSAALEDLIYLTTTPGLLDHTGSQAARDSWLRHIREQ